MDKQLATGKTTIRWIEDDDVYSDIKTLAARQRVTVSEWIRTVIRAEIRAEQEHEVLRRLAP